MDNGPFKRSRLKEIQRVKIGLEGRKDLSTAA
jgi:hypothetical protein